MRFPPSTLGWWIDGEPGAALWRWAAWHLRPHLFPDPPTAPTYTLSGGRDMAPYVVTVNPPAAKDATAVKLYFTYTVAPDGGQPGDPVVVDATAGIPPIDLNPGESLTGTYRTVDANGVTTPESAPTTIKAPTAPASPTYTLANAPAPTPAA